MDCFPSFIYSGFIWKYLLGKLSYYIFVCIMILIIRASTLWSAERSGKIALLTCTGTVPGLGHLWFISTILVCYLFTPIFHSIVKEIDKENDCLFFIRSIVLFFIIHTITKYFFDMWIPAWINCYVLGMLFGGYEERFKKYSAFVTVLCMLMVTIVFRIDYWPYDQLPETLVSIYATFRYYVKVVLGMFLVMGIRKVYKKFEIVGEEKKHIILSWSDKYSYDVYLVHQVFVLSSFGCVEFIENRYIALPLAVILIVFFGMLLNKISNLVRMVIGKFYRRLISTI